MKVNQIIIFFLFSFFHQLCFSQIEVPDSLKHKNYQQVIPLPSIEEGGTTIIQRQPMYPNGAKGILQHIQDSLVYPEDALENNKEGTVVVKFVIDTLGNVTNISVVESVYPSLDAEAIRVISVMDKWLPAIQRNKLQKVAFKQPVIFSIKENKKKTKKK